MNEYCADFNCVSKCHCNDYDNGDGCSEIQCDFQYDCEFCTHQEECRAEKEDV